MTFTNEYTETLKEAVKAGWECSGFELAVIFEEETAHSAGGYCATFNFHTWGKVQETQVSIDAQDISFCHKCSATSKILHNGIKGQTQVSELVNTLRNVLRFEEARQRLEARRYFDFPEFEKLEEGIGTFLNIEGPSLAYYQEWVELIKARLLKLKEEAQVLKPQDLKDLIEDCVYYLVPTFEGNLLNFPEVVAELEGPRESARQALREDGRWAVFTLGKTPTNRECSKDAFNVTLQHFMVKHADGKRLLYAPLVVCEFMRETGMTKDWSLAPSGLAKSSLEALWVLHYADPRGVYSDMKTALEAAIAL